MYSTSHWQTVALVPSKQFLSYSLSLSLAFPCACLEFGSLLQLRVPSSLSAFGCFNLSVVKDPKNLIFPSLQHFNTCWDHSTGTFWPCTHRTSASYHRRIFQFLLSETMTTLFFYTRKIIIFIKIIHEMEWCRAVSCLSQHRWAFLNEILDLFEVGMFCVTDQFQEHCLTRCDERSALPQSLWAQGENDPWKVLRMSYALFWIALPPLSCISGSNTSAH